MEPSVHLTDGGSAVFCPTRDDPPELTEDATEVTCQECQQTMGQITADTLLGLTRKLATYDLRWVRHETVERTLCSAQMIAIVGLPSNADRNGYYRLDAIKEVRLRAKSNAACLGGWATYSHLWNTLQIKRGWLDDAVRLGVVSVLVADPEAYFSVADIEQIQQQQAQDRIDRARLEKRR